MKILICAYASEPGAGSEYGVGWMVPTKLAALYPENEVYVLTRSRCREKIEKAIGGTSIGGYQVDAGTQRNLHFLFYDIPNWMFYKDEMKSNWGEQINYWLWQVMVKGFVKTVHKEIGFDVIHHLTFNQYRTPAPGFWMDIPFVMGPIGGAETIAESFDEDLLPHTARKEEIRRKGKDLALFGWFMRRRKNKKVILCSCAENMRRLKKYSYGNDMRILPAIAYSKEDFDIEPQMPTAGTFELLYAGKAWDWKGIRIFLRAARKAFLDRGVKDFAIKLVGIRFEEEQKLVTGWIRESGLEGYVTIIPFIQRSELLKMMTSIDLSVYPAFRDSGSMSILEASALGCPTICFDAGGQDIFPDDVLIKVPVGATYEENLNAFAERLNWAYTHKDQAHAIGCASKEWVEKNLTWERKVREFVGIYKKSCVERIEIFQMI